MFHSPLISGVFASVNSSLNITNVGQDCLRLTQYKPTELIGQAALILFDESSADSIMHGIQQGLLGKSLDLKCSILDRSGISHEVELVVSPRMTRAVSSGVDMFLRVDNPPLPDRRKIPNMIALHAPLQVILYEMAAGLEHEYPQYAVSISYESLDKQTVLHVETERMPVKCARESFDQGIRPLHCLAALRYGGTFSTDDIKKYPECELCHWLEIDGHYSACWSRVMVSPHGDSLGKFAVHSPADQQPTQEVLDIFVLYSAMAELAIWNNYYEATLVNQIEHDDLTALFTFHKFTALLEQVLARCHEVTMLYVDVDNFEFVNESLGHSTGNVILRELGRRIAEWCGSERVPGRLAGDEFGVILPNITSSDALQLGKELLNIVQYPIDIENDVVYITASLGVGVGTDAMLLLENAFKACSEAKEVGGDTVALYGKERDANTLRVFELMRDMHAALDLNQLSVYYQARVNPFTRQIVAAEALLRWNHPEWGIIPPGDFIGILEEHGLMHRVTEWIITTVCTDLDQWKMAGLDLVPISVNFSPRQLIRPHLVSLLVREFTERNLETSLLQVEVTERHTIRQQDKMRNVIRELARFGIRTLIDDFGEGSTSFAYLNNEMTYAIKIEKEVTDRILEDSSAATIVSCVIELAHKLGILAVVEGVETIEQMEALCKMNCDELQGYLFSKPIPMRAFELLLQLRYISLPSGIPVIERRRFFRVNLSTPLIGRLTIKQIGSRTVDVGWSDVLIENMGAGGLAVVTALRLPLDTNTLVRIKTVIFEDIEFTANLVWITELRSHLYKYGVSFILTDGEQTALIRKLNLLSGRLRRNPKVAGCTMYTGKTSEFFGRVNI